MRTALVILTLASLTFSIMADDFTLTFTGDNKWLTQEQKKPLLALRNAVTVQKTQPVTLSLKQPNINPKLQAERLAIISEIISRNADSVFIKVAPTTSAAKNQFIFTLN